MDIFGSPVLTLGSLPRARASQAPVLRFTKFDLERLACQLSTRCLACRAEGGKEAAGPLACPLKADSLRPTAAADRPARRSRPPPGSRARPACEHTLVASPPTPEDSAGCRHGFRLASTASRAAARRGPMKHRRLRPTDLSRGHLDIAICHVSTHAGVEVKERAVNSSPGVG